MGSPKGLGRDGGVYGLGFRVWVYGLGFPIMEIMPGDHEPNHPKHLARNPKLNIPKCTKGPPVIFRPRNKVQGGFKV